MRFDDLFSIEVAHAAATPMKCVVLLKVGDEAAEVFNPSIMLIPIDQVDRLLISILRCIEWITTLPLVVEEGVDVIPFLKLCSMAGMSAISTRELDRVQFEGVEQVIVVSGRAT